MRNCERAFLGVRLCGRRISRGQHGAEKHWASKLRDEDAGRAKFETRTSRGESREAKLCDENFRDEDFEMRSSEIGICERRLLRGDAELTIRRRAFRAENSARSFRHINLWAMISERRNVGRIKLRGGTSSWETARGLREASEMRKYRVHRTPDEELCDES